MEKPQPHYTGVEKKGAKQGRSRPASDYRSTHGGKWV
jgi:hypothetical protein